MYVDTRLVSVKSQEDLVNDNGKAELFLMAVHPRIIAVAHSGESSVFSNTRND